MEGIELICCDGRSPGETLGDGWFEVLIVAAMDRCRFAGLDVGKDLQAVSPEGGVDWGEYGAVTHKLLLPCGVGFEDFGLGIVEELFADAADAWIGWRG